MEYVVALVIGLLAGAHTSTWGMYKDSPHEGFSTVKYFRSIIVAVCLAPLLLHFTQLNLLTPAGMVVFFGFTYVCERGLVELWKTFWRDEDQSKYFIPMQFHVNGRLIKSAWKRRLIGVFYAGGVLAICFGIRWLQRTGVRIPTVVVLVTIGSIGGWISAIGGAWKDAPIEGFQTFKFFRSPLVSLSFATLMSLFTDDWFLITLAGLGYTVASIETYKTFFFPSVPRGKFAGKPIDFPQMLKRRQYFVPLFAGIWLAILITVAVAIASPLLGSGSGGASEVSRMGSIPPEALAPPSPLASAEADDQPTFGRLTAAWCFFSKRRLDLRWTVMLRSIGAVALVCIPLVHFLPQTAVLVAFALASLPINGPLSPLLPTAWEPLIIETTRYYHPVVVATVGFAVYMYMEYLNFYIYRWVLARERLAQLQQKRAVQRAVDLFGRRPFLTVFLFALTPLPFWAGRVLAIWNKYPIRPFMLATALGRYPRILAYAWLGHLLDPPGWLLLVVGIGIPLGVILHRLLRGGRLLDSEA